MSLFFNKKIIYIISIFFIISIGHISYLEYKYNNLYIEKDNCKINGKIVDILPEKENKHCYKIKIYSIEDISKYKNTQFIVYVKKQKNSEKLLVGDIVKFTGNIQKPVQARNYKGFDYQTYLKGQNIIGSINTRKVEVLKHENPSIFYIIKQNIINKLDNIYSSENASIIKGILIGDTSSLNEHTKQYFRQSGLYHALAVSGMHVSYLILGINLLLKNYNKKFLYIASILIIFIFMLVTGMSPSITRAGIMSIILMISKIIYTKSDILTNISIASLIILIFNPYDLLNIGFLLSFGGTVGIVVLSKLVDKIINKRKNKIVSIISVTLSAQIILIPILIAFFNTVAIYSIISSILTSFLISVIFILGLVILIISYLFPYISSILAQIESVFIQILYNIIKVISELPFSDILIVTPSNISIIIYYTIVAVIGYYIHIKQKIDLNKLEVKYIRLVDKVKKKIPVIILVVLILSITYNFIPKDLKIYFIDVGQGDSTLCVTPYNKTILIDGGGSEFSEEYDVGENVLVPYLLDRKIKVIDYMLISHFDSDHVGGLFAVVESLKIKNIIISKQSEITENYQNMMMLAEQKNINIIYVKSGDKILVEKDVSIEILFPTKEVITEDSINNNSIVAKLIYNNFTALFTGDIQEPAENRLVNIYNKRELKCDLLKIAHHGSKTSTTEEFLKKAKPKIALIGVGENNTFGHPNENVIDRLNTIGCKIYRTDEDGEVSIIVNRKGGVKTKVFIE